MPSGIGGHMLIPLTEEAIRVEEWTVDKQVESDDTTDSGSDGWRDREALLKDGTGTVNIIYRVGDSMEDRSLDIGDEAAVMFLLGTTGQAYSAFIHIKSVNTTNPAKGNAVIRQRCTWEHKEGGILGPTAVGAAQAFLDEGIERLMSGQDLFGLQEKYGQKTSQRGSFRSARGNQPERADLPRQSANANRSRYFAALGKEAPAQPASAGHRGGEGGGPGNQGDRPDGSGEPKQPAHAGS